LRNETILAKLTTDCINKDGMINIIVLILVTWIRQTIMWHYIICYFFIWLYVRTNCKNMGLYMHSFRVTNVEDDVNSIMGEMWYHIGPDPLCIKHLGYYFSTRLILLDMFNYIIDYVIALWLIYDLSTSITNCWP